MSGQVEHVMEHMMWFLKLDGIAVTVRSPKWQDDVYLKKILCNCKSHFQVTDPGPEEKSRVLESQISRNPKRGV
jgi:hypothetical protein